MKSPLTFNHSLLCCLPFLIGTSLQAQSIIWGAAGTGLRGVPIVQSDGEPITLAEFSIEFGAFNTGFVPTTANIDQWVGNWNVFDAITESDMDPQDSFVSMPMGTPGSAFSGTAVLTMGNLSNSEDADPAHVFEVGQQAYVFIRNSDATGPDAEFALYTSQNDLGSGDNIHQFPVGSGDQTSTTSVIFGLGDIDTAVFGSANGVVGAGEFAAGTTPDGIRTHTFAAVPEPSSGLLAFVGGLLLLRRRR